MAGLRSLLDSVGYYGFSIPAYVIPQASSRLSVAVALAVATSGPLSLQGPGQRLSLATWDAHRSLQRQPAGLLTFCPFPAIWIGGTV